MFFYKLLESYINRANSPTNNASIRESNSYGSIAEPLCTLSNIPMFAVAFYYEDPALMFAALKSGILTPSDEKQYEIFQTNFLAMYPFMDPQNGSTINVPQKINEEWFLVTYTVQRLDISPQSGPLSVRHY